MPLALGLAAAAVGVGLSFLSGPSSVAAPLAGWACCALLAVGLVAWFQAADLRGASSSMSYRSAPGARLLRIVTLVVAFLGTGLNSVAFAQWVATR